MLQAQNVPNVPTPVREQFVRMEGFGQRLRARARKLGKPDAWVANEAGLSPRRYSNYVNNEREPEYDVLVKISRVLKTTPNWLLGVEADPSGEDDRSHLLPDLLPLYRGELSARLIDIGNTEFASLARYDAAISAGTGSIIEPGAEPLGYALIEAQWLRSVTLAAPEHLAALRVDGDSMVDTLYDGDWILVDKTQRRLSRPGIYAIEVGDAAWVKRITPNLERKLITVISDNPRYPIQELEEEELRPIGRAVSVIARKL